MPATQARSHFSRPDLAADNANAPSYVHLVVDGLKLAGDHRNRHHSEQF